MSTTLILNAGTSSPVNLVVQTAGEGAPQEVGSITQSFNGADRSSVRGVKRNYGSLTTYLDTVSKDAVINLLKAGAQLPCSGDLLANIQTQCTVRYTGCRMIQGTATGLWEVGLSLSEVQSSVTLLRYSPGDTITGETFTGAAGRRYYDSFGVLQSAALNAKRDAHYINGVRSLLLEDARTNICLQSENFGTTWVAVATPTRSAGAHTSAGVSLDLIGDDNAGAVEGYSQTIAFTGNAVKGIAIFVKLGSSTSSVLHLSDATASVTRLLAALTWSGSVPVVTMTTGTFLGYDGLANGVYRLKFATTSVTAANTNTLFVYPANVAAGDVTKTGDIYAGGVSVENAPFPSSYIPTTTVAVTRGAEIYSLPFTTPPQEMSAYVKFVEMGTALFAASARLFDITSAGDAAPRFLCYYPGTGYAAFHETSAGSVSAGLATAPVLNDVTELECRLFGDGSVDAQQSLNSATATSATQSAAKTPSTAWAGQLLYLNSGGSASVGYTAIQSFKIIAGARSIAEMRAA